MTPAPVIVRRRAPGEKWREGGRMYECGTEGVGYARRFGTLQRPFKGNALGPEPGADRAPCNRAASAEGSGRADFSLWTWTDRRDDLALELTFAAISGVALAYFILEWVAL